MDESFFSIVRNSILEVRAAYKMEKLISDFSDKFVMAKKKLDLGNPLEMLALGNLSLGDAWRALAEFYDKNHSLVDADRLATEAFLRATEAQLWIDNTSNFCKTQYETRWFLGLGIDPDYLKLFELWSDKFTSDNREVEMAWICTFGPLELRDLKAACLWLCLGEERWSRSECPPVLPSGDFVSLHEYLVKKISKQIWKRLQKESKHIVYAEFIQNR
ncbi:MAG: hypothetical protein PHI02_05515 [Sulfurovaceae bacterium]|nr:hypothetical protein [Sulfurovaceae bacterium]